MSGNQKSQWYERCCGDRAGEHDPETAADRENRRDERDPVRNALARELVADDPVGEREDRACGALNDPRDEHEADRRRKPGDRRPDRQQNEHDDERALLAEHVAETAGDRREHRSAEEIRRQDPPGSLGARVEIALDRQQRRRNERLEQRVRNRRDGEQRERDVVVRACRTRGSSRAPRRAVQLRTREWSMVLRRGRLTAQAVEHEAEVAAPALRRDGRAALDHAMGSPEQER